MCPVKVAWFMDGKRIDDEAGEDVDTYYHGKFGDSKGVGTRWGFDPNVREMHNWDYSGPNTDRKIIKKPNKGDENLEYLHPNAEDIEASKPYPQEEGQEKTVWPERKKPPPARAGIIGRKHHGSNEETKHPSTAFPGKSGGLHPEFSSRLGRMYHDMPGALKKGTYVFSGHRSHEHQARLFAHSNRSGHMVARPGHSQHERGMAADLRFGSKAARDWVHRNASKYGLRFPMGYEPWHIEPNEARSGRQFKSPTPQAGSQAPAGHSRSSSGTPIIGQLSHYNPYKPGWKEGGPHTASGERYSETEPTAAVQQGLRSYFGGIGHGKNYKPSYADVEYGGKKLRVRVNDVMPYSKGGRVLDLNEAAMKYFDPSMKQGVLHGARVTPVRDTKPDYEP